MARHSSLAEQSVGHLSEAVGSRAANLFESGAMLCAPAVLVCLNEALGGGLDRKTAHSMSAAFPEGMGGSGCLCGALAGANLALGLFLGHNKWKKMAVISREMHDAFKEKHGATCCRVLSKKVKHDPKLHMRQCVGLTGWTAETAARIIVAHRPELQGKADWDFLDKRDSKVKNGIKRILTLG